MNRGYQVLEPEQLGSLFSSQKYFNFAIPIFYWLIEQLNIELKDQLVGVQIEVIQFVHHSPDNRYPCLGVHYDNPVDTPNLAPLIEATIDRLLQNRSILELVTFIGDGGNDWNAITTKIMAKENQ